MVLPICSFWVIDFHTAPYLLAPVRRQDAAGLTEGKQLTGSQYTEMEKERVTITAVYLLPTTLSAIALHLGL